MLLTGCVSSLSAQQSFWKEDFSAGKLPDGWMIVDSTKSAKCEWIVTDQPYPGSFQFEQQAPPIASTSRGYHMQFRPGVVTWEEITKWNQREEYPNGYFQTSAIDVPAFWVASAPRERTMGRALVNEEINIAERFVGIGGSPGKRTFIQFGVSNSAWVELERV